ncbi:GNAT family N-acetyltransferase [Flavobacteriaceae bacterium TP-CH-4]|uniref:GNAT family N-acetyltransferase n=1 Tax=Pelagihabitans pacificus TaxID=2696054 RepID=A0A967AXY3_9FLAO|nr:GNAT family N-acetyltransferase [Pelagihabitans pacificus]NHF58616.1 GNAT family N-acetyltransferase [Pelagihabitans pacificus]
MAEISFRKAIPSDSLRISVLLKTVYVQTYAVEGVTFEFANFITNRFAASLIEKNIRAHPDRVLLACFNENPVGVAEIIYESNCPIRNISVPELSKLYLLERFYGKGMGYGLLKEVEKQLALRGHKELNLEVYVHNDRAISFYKRQGYTTLGMVDFPMESNTYKNWVMSKKLDQ